ncbi:hydroxymethylbilane synthase [Clostridium sp. AL.422]|uniref:hydroxymethylbilane synthase n=1 Tax=Clostridium TaxID=1485 RepID=UPI00293DD224|nr:MULTISPECIES: hydroxymethylbilane synthase [unclassified Clostridium]MDV4149462.1 hydroxymethylbilane synthase [Clostridium sp. AL.422]
MEIIIATRKSKLAQVQADRVIELIKEKNNINSKKLLVVTEGDRRLDVTLDKIGGKGLFVKEIEYALLNKEAHAAVHSMKDVPFELPNGFKLIAIPEREDIRDVFVSRNNIHFEDLKEGAVIGTSSIRRAAMLRNLRKDLKIVPIRGNVQTRLQKMENENMDGIILAAAGLKRLNMESYITDYFDPKIFLPAIGQGALGIEALENGEFNSYLKKLDNTEVRIALEAERSFMKELNGGCHTVIGVYSEIKGKDLYMIGTYDLGDGRIIKKDILGNKENHIEIGTKLAKEIMKG